jgi:hypothetical protein
MKIKLIALLVFAAATHLFANPPWNNKPPNSYHWVVVEDLPPAENGDYRYLVKAQTNINELIYYDEQSFVTHDLGRSYFSSDGYIDSAGNTVISFPPGWIVQEDLDNGYTYKYKRINYFAPGCGEMPKKIAYRDSIYIVAAIMYWNAVNPQYKAGYVIAGYAIKQIFRIVCEISGANPDKDKAFFTDSTYVALPDNAIISGDSPLYVSVELGHSTWAKARFSLTHAPDSVVQIDLRHDGYYWRGHIANSKILGLKSYAKAKVKIVCNGIDSLAAASMPDSVIVCLPKADVQGKFALRDRVYRDTVFISHDSMKVVDDVPVFLVCKDDATGKEINIKNDVDSVGYRYRSMWRSNTSQPDTMFQQRYYRIYRRDSTYVRWTNAFPNDLKTCLVKLNHDSLYAIGGKLTIEARGALKHVDNINNAFKVNSDSITPQGDTIRHKILIDSDPSNAEFINYLGNDTVRAIAWKEWAGYGAHLWHHQYRPRLNHYWDTFIVNGNTCPRDTFLFKPIESTTDSNTATGIMQILRTAWERQFDGRREDGPIDTFNGRYPFYCKWDSVAWNWKVFVHKGAYIINKYLPEKIDLDAIQKTFPDSCPFAECDTFPSKKNKTDLIALGYNQGFPFMRRVKNDSLWGVFIADTTGPEIPEYCKYVQEVRKYFYRKPW